jgi:hypothetical protein
MVGPGGFEPPTLRLSGVRSNQLSYEPELLRLVHLITAHIYYFQQHLKTLLVELAGIEPATSSLQS